MLLDAHLSDLVKSKDQRAMGIVRCLKRGLKWAGSSFIEFVSGGVSRLLQFLSEMREDSNPMHDVDMYRTTKKTGTLGVRIFGKG